MFLKFNAKNKLYRLTVCTLITVSAGISFAFASDFFEPNVDIQPIEITAPQKVKTVSNTQTSPQIIQNNIENQLEDINNSFNVQDSHTNDNLITLSRQDVMQEIENAFSNAPRDVFTPLEETRNGITTIKTLPKEDLQLQDLNLPLPPKDLNVAVDNDVSYYASVDPEQNVSMEGRMVHSVDIQGLKTVKPEVVLSKINTKIGSTFNSSVIQEDLQNIFSTGYFTDIMAVEPTLRYDGSVDLIFTLQENILVSEVEIIGNKVIPTVELQQFITPLQGMPQNLSEINKSIEGINEYYHSRGYILETVENVDDNAEGKLSIIINEGIIKKINFVGNEKTKTFVIERNTLTKAGDVYNEELLKKDLVAIYATQIFADVDREIKPSEDNDGTYDVNVIVKEKSTNNISLGGGLDSGLGVFGSVGIKEDNFLGRAQKISLSGLIGSGILLSDASIKNRINYQVSLDFLEPHFINADTSLASKIYFRELGSYQVPLAVERRYGINAVLEHKLKNYEHVSTTFATGIENIKLTEGDYADTLALYCLRGIDISERAKELTGGWYWNIAPGVRYSNLDDNELPRQGVVAQARFTEALGLNSVSKTNGRLSGMVTRYLPVFKNSTVALTAKGGIKVHGDEMPEVMAYRLGGPYTIRGFRLNGVGTGESFIMGSAELITPIPLFDKIKYDIFKKMRFAFFVDAGKVFRPTVASYLYDRPLSAISVGVGIRIPIPGIGPLTVDYGLPLTSVGAFGSKGGYVTFGTGYMEGY